MPSLQDLGAEVVAVGTLIGLLTQDQNDRNNFSVNTGWFDNPIDNGFSSIPNRLDSLVTLLNDLLGPGVGYSVTGFDDAQWYAIPSPTTGQGSLFCLVAPQGAPTSGQIGCGALYQYTDSTDNLIYTAYAYIPLFNYSPTGAQWIMGNDGNPLLIGFSVTTTASPFTVGTVKFTALKADASIYFDQDPTVQVYFDQLQGAQITQPLTTLNDLLASDVESWIAQVIVQGATLLNTDISHTLEVSVGGLLLSAGFLSVDSSGTYHLDLAQLQNLDSAADIAQHFLIGVLDALSGDEEPIPFFEFPGGGVYVARLDSDDGNSDYGLRVALDFALPSPAASSGVPSPAINLSFGSWPTGDDDDDNWVQRSNPNLADIELPGISVYMLRCAPDFSLSFAPSFALSSVGINIAGGANTPLINIEGFTLQGVEIRGYLDSDGWVYGFAGRFDGVGFPLGPAFGSAVTGSETNPVAQNLLSSGSGGNGGSGGGGSGSNGGGGGGDTGSGDQNPVNPAFSVAGGYVQGGSFSVQLYDASDQPSDQVIIPIQRTLGPLRAEKLGIGWVQSTDMLSLLFDGGISLAGFSVDLQGLSIGVPLASPNDFSKYDLDLDGLGMTLSEGPVEISAALMKLPPDPNATPPRNYTEYDGEALVKAANFSLQALGSYAYVPNPNGDGGYTSLFIFAILDAVLGGPEFFFVTGLAAGFGYNRALILPDQSSVPQFPLVAGASDPGALGGTKQEDGSWVMPDPATALQNLDQFVPPERGEYWLAVGVRYTSFDLINSTALLTVEFGNELEIALLDISSMTLPPPPEPGASAPPVSYAYGELGIEIKLLPSEGVFTATGILTPNSFVIDPACHLTGGFAFYVWFGDNPHSGQFVLTLGGYHPDFSPPSYYPSVPRLGFNWPVSSEVNISGDAYFALTPSAVMAGAGLQVTFNSGDLSAWFKGQMDALITWAPFSYLIDISVDIGASYRAHIGSLTHTFRIDLSADVTIWGPPMGGRAHVDWTVISFTVNFGASQNDTPPPLSWINDDGTGFAQTLLPHTTPQSQSSRMAARVAGALTEGTSTQSQTTPNGIYTITANDGLLKTFTDDSGDTVWVVRSNHFKFSALTAIPTTSVQITGATNTIDARDVSPAGDSYSLAIRPMNAVLASSVFTITMVNQDGSPYDLNDKFDNDPALSSVPAAKWGQPLPPGQAPEPNTLLAGCLMGLNNLTPKMPALTPSGAGLLDVDVATAFAYDVVDRDSTDHLPLQPIVPDVPLPQVSSNSLQRIEQTLMQPEQIAARQDIFAALQGYGIAAGKNGELRNLAAGADAFYTDNPLLYLPPQAEPVWRRRNP